MELLLVIPLLVLYVILFFSGWAGVYFLSGKSVVDTMLNDGPVWKLILGWGVYLGSMISYPLIVLPLTGLAIMKITGTS